MYLDLQVWAVNLVLYSLLPEGMDVGEAWMSPASWIQLFGFSLLLAGTVIYAQVSHLHPRFHSSTLHGLYSQSSLEF